MTAQFTRRALLARGTATSAALVAATSGLGPLVQKAVAAVGEPAPRRQDNYVALIDVAADVDGSIDRAQASQAVASFARSYSKTSPDQQASLDAILDGLDDGPRHFASLPHSERLSLVRDRCRALPDSSGDAKSRCLTATALGLVVNAFAPPGAVREPGDLIVAFQAA